MKMLFALILLFVATASTLARQGSESLIQEKTIALEKVEGRIDHLAVDVAGQRLFVAALGNNSIEVIDLQKGKRTQSLAGFAEPQGIAFVPEVNKIFVANGLDGTCRILDGATFKVTKSVELGDDADNVRYDEKSKRICVGYGSGALGVIDAGTGAKVGELKLSRHPESFRIESDGVRIFVNVPGANQISVVDRQSMTVTGTWPMKEARANFPMSLDEANHRVFVGCRNLPKLLVYDFSGHLIASVPIARDTDDLYCDAAKKLIYVTCGEGFIDVIRQTDADHYEKLKSISTVSGARTSLFVPELKALYLAVPRRGGHDAEIRVYKTE